MAFFAASYVLCSLFGCPNERHWMMVRRKGTSIWSTKLIADCFPPEGKKSLLENPSHFHPFFSDGCGLEPLAGGRGALKNASLFADLIHSTTRLPLQGKPRSKTGGAAQRVSLICRWKLTMV